MTDLAHAMREEIERMRTLHAAEVRVLEHRVRTLEQALVEANLTGTGSRLPTAADIASARRGDDPVSAWDDDDATFAEKVAAREFFRSDAEHGPSRAWLLGSR